MDKTRKELLDELLEEFKPLIDNYKKHGCVTKVCYGLNNKHMELLLELQKEYNLIKK